MHIEVLAPATSKPTDAEFYSEEHPDRPNLEFLKQHLHREGRLTEEQALSIIHKGTELLRTEPNLLEVDAPVTGRHRFLRIYLLDRSLLPTLISLPLLSSMRRRTRAVL